MIWLLVVLWVLPMIPYLEWNGPVRHFIFMVVSVVVWLGLPVYLVFRMRVE